MLIIRTINEAVIHLSKLKKEGISIGLVPTMGALHPGHLSLVNRCKKDNQCTLVSIFVNPTQFNDKKDLDKYPRTEEEDLLKLEKSGCDIVFIPTVNEIYPSGTEERLNLDLGVLDRVMEGLHRPGHFSGVVTVVNRLFEILQPDSAYFGKKDFQQLAVIRHLVKKRNIPVRIVACETEREPDGLAMSSRNMLLTPEERKEAPFIFRVLLEARTNSANQSVPALKQWTEQRFVSNKSFTLEYFELVDAETLQPVPDWNSSGKIIGCIAARIGNVRLIDNIVIKEKAG